MSSQFPSKETVEHLRKRYLKGTSVELVFMDDPYSKLVPGDRGKVAFVDDTGTIFVNWDKGSNLGIVLGQDSVKIIEEKVVNPLAASEVSTEQNYDMIDGLHNNIATGDDEKSEPYLTIETKAIFDYKEASVSPSDCVIRKVIRLSDEEYDQFSQDLFAYRDFIHDNIELMGHDNNDRVSCILVMGTTAEDGILVNSSGYDYARYSAFLPKARILLDQGLLFRGKQTEKQSVLEQIREHKKTTPVSHKQNSGRDNTEPEL